MRPSIILIVLVGWYHQIIEALECAVPHEDQIRVFYNLTLYEGNKLPFSPLRGGWKGSTVEFSVSTIAKLEKNSFITAHSTSVITLKLNGKQIKEVDEGAFISLLCLHQLLLDHNNIAKLTRNVFQGLENLRKLDLSYNKLEILTDFTFANLVKLERLHLENNQIKTVEIAAFISLTQLQYLNLEHNEIKKVDNDLFRPLPNLTFLILSWNKFGDLDWKWRDLDKLQNLELAGNNLNYFSPSYNISYPSLKSLNLSFNSLTLLNVGVLRRHFPKLEVLDLNNNRRFCDDLSPIVQELNDLKIKYSTGGVQKIDCSEVSRYYSTTGAIVVSTSTSTRKNEVWVDQNQLERYVEKKIEDNNENLKSTIASIRSIAIFAFSLLCIYIVFEVLYRTNVFGFVYSRFRGGNELYVDNGTDVENFRLLHR